MLFCEEVCAPCMVETHWVHPAALLYDVGFVIGTGLDVATTRAFASSSSAFRCPPQENPDSRAIEVQGRDGNYYLLAANLGEQPQIIISQGEWVDLAERTTFNNEVEVPALYALVAMRTRH